MNIGIKEKDYKIRDCFVQQPLFAFLYDFPGDEAFAESLAGNGAHPAHLRAAH